MNGLLKYLQQLNRSVGWLHDFMQRALAERSPSLCIRSEKDRQAALRRHNLVIVYGQGRVEGAVEHRSGSSGLTIIAKRQ